MDGISFIDALQIYSLLFSPILTMLLLMFWMSANIKKIANTQLLGIVILLVLAFLAINSPMIAILGGAAVFLFIIWLATYSRFFLKEQSSITLHIFLLQIAHYVLFFALLSFQYHLALTLMCIIPIFSMIRLYPWAFGNKNISNGRAFIIIAFIIQVILACLNIAIPLIETYK